MVSASPREIFELLFIVMNWDSIQHSEKDTYEDWIREYCIDISNNFSNLDRDTFHRIGSKTFLLSILDRDYELIMQLKKDKELEIYNKNFINHLKEDSNE